MREAYPSNGVMPIVVSMLLPCLMQHMLLPAPANISRRFNREGYTVAALNIELLGSRIVWGKTKKKPQ
jgi:hypothetical protein